MSVLRAPRSAVLPLILAAACWGLGTVVAKRAVAEISPIALLTIQLGSSLLFLAVLMRVRGLPYRDPAASPVLGRLGLLNPGVAYALSLLGLVSISASLSVLLWALEPLLILLLAVAFLHERVGRTVVTLSAIAIAGLALIAAQPGPAALAGVALTVAGVVCCAVYTIVTRRWIATADSTLQVVLAQQAYAFGLAATVAGGLVVAGRLSWPDGLSGAAVASAVGSGVLYYAFAYWFYLSGLRKVPASLAAASFYLVPVFGVAGGLLFLGEGLSTGQWVGVGVVAAAVGAILWRTRTGDASQLNPAIVRSEA
ncbi:MAG: DMT family transporter [Chloroflexota bacterium]